MDLSPHGAPRAVFAGSRPAGIEVERRFLVSADGWRPHVFTTSDLREGLLCAEGGNKVRVRTDGQAAWITIKGPRTGPVRAEFEYPVPLADAEAMLATLCGNTVLEKRRHLLRHGDHLWEVDVYGGALAGIVHAEIELASAEEAFVLPDWVGEEVTGDPAHSKSALQRRLAPASVA